MNKFACVFPLKVVLQAHLNAIHLNSVWTFPFKKEKSVGTFLKNPVSSIRK
jgi:hypothetical protein